MKKIIVIGAGPAGLTFGYEMLSKSKDFEVVILEESNAFGGISRTVCHNGNRMDIGGHRFFSKDKRVNEWWAKMMPLQGAPSFDDKVLHREIDLIPNNDLDPEQVDRVMLKRKRVSRIYYQKRFFDYPVKMNLQTIKNMGFVTTAIAGFSYFKATINKKEETSLESFYINRFGKKLYSMFFEGYTEKLWGRHPKQISADWGSQRVKGLSISAVLKSILQKFIPGNKEVETSLIEEFLYPKYGPGQLWETVVDEIKAMGGTIIKNAKVVKINTSGNIIDSVVYFENGLEKRMECDLVVSSMPIKDFVSAQNSAPENIQRIASGLPYRDFVTVGLLLNKLNLKNETKLKTLSNIVPDCWIYVQDTGAKLGRIQIFNNWSPYLVKDPEKTVWIGLEYFCNEGDPYWNMSADEWKTKGVDELVSMGVINKGDEIKDSHCEKVKKAYPAYFDTYSEIDTLISYLNGFDNLYCIGRNGQHRYNNMDHSMVTAYETVDNILTGKRDKTNIWHVNTEKEYHEDK